jgi:hypothetical protein
MTYADEPLPRDTSPAENPGAPDGVAAAEVAEAMAVYSADGQVDDATGGDAGAEVMRAEDPDAGVATRPGPGTGAGPA